MERILRRALLVSAILAFLGGCADVEPRRNGGAALPPGAHAVFVVDHGYHTGLAVRARDVPEAAWPARRDFPDADYLEMGWGAREYYPRDDPGIWLALRALFVPSASTLNVVAITGALTPARRGREIIELHLSDAGFKRMVEFVRETYELDAHGGGIVVSSGVQQEGRFYASPRIFHAFENCNTWVARALQSAGLPVRPETVITAGMLLRQVRRLSADAEVSSAPPAASSRQPQ